MKLGSLNKTRCDGFSMLELFVVMGIIAAVIAITLPVLGRMRETAQRTNCVAQLRQIYAGLLAYSQDYRGYLPRAATSAELDEPEIQNWYGTWLRPMGDVSRAFPAYVGGTVVLDRLAICPSNLYPAVARKGGTYTPLGIPYVCNYEAMTQNGLSRRPANLWTVNKERLILMTDSDPDQWKGPGFTKTAGWERIGERHQQKVNTLWADGRIEQMRKAEIKREYLEPRQ